ncbi:MAG: hypothetical protein A2X13_13755 [Bacteroidetes bacterium GWC2_33_15]|nr:MAG: hypothetical protein A2X10_08970 [Bacteroidetes bacterium GWA2_33_15]OFX50411.1 MAG: hypothetical protein A2X13_13755 [Bacteroidetes bacterium GWC2_33_15]OFX66671.1 MAG: hypothetical protein A2X15_08120 [Bacteroidetes bacterium GWB2_32_14]OFX69289.1 MAG: hypothetical protein A2X14_09050 [Bacteroidetes bacterium GWD2_33_33]HAN18604.1 hypothetical protein [Bacteroidales bacterium]
MLKIICIHHNYLCYQRSIIFYWISIDLLQIYKSSKIIPEKLIFILKIMNFSLIKIITLPLIGFISLF